MGHTAWFASRLDLDRATPRPELASSGYVLADPGVEYLVYMPLDPHPLSLRRFSSVSSGRSETSGRVSRRRSASISRRVPVPILWSGSTPRAARRSPAEPVIGGGMQSFTAPFVGDAVLYLKLRP